jgi:hypothetical protein
MTNRNTHEVEFLSAREAREWMAICGLARVDALGYAGTRYSDEGEKIVVVARKSGPLSYTLTEKAA